MALQYPGYSPVQASRSSLESLLPAYDEGRTQRRSWDAEQVMRNGGGASPGQPPQSAMEMLAGFGSQPYAPSAGPMTAAPTDMVTQSHAAVAGAQDPALVAHFAGQQAAAPNMVAQSHQAAANAQDPTLTGYFASARAAESGGNDMAANPKSSALGRYQFLDGTWRGLMEQYPELGLTAEGRTDPAQQERAMGQFTQDNARVLGNAGIPVNPGNLYAAHFLGAGGASNVLGQDPASPMSAYVDPGVIEANPHLANMSVGDFINWTQSKGGNSNGGYAPPMPHDQPRAGNQRQFSNDEIATLMMAEETRPFAMQILQAQQQGGRYETIEQPDGSIWQVDRMTGEQQILQQPPTPAKPPSPTALMQNLEAAGLQPGTPEYQDAVLKGISTGVTVNTGDNSGAFLKKADEEAAGRLGAIVESGQGAAQFMGDVQALVALGGQIDTGKGAEIMAALGPYAEAMGVQIDGLGEAQAYQAIIDRMAPAMRPAGSGAASDFDARQFLSSLPSLGRTPEGNAIITDTLTAMQQHKMAAAEIAAQSFMPPDQGGITWQEAEKRLRELPNPYEGFNAYAERVSGAQAGGALPAGVTEEDVQHTMQVHGLTREEVLERIGNATP